VAAEGGDEGGVGGVVDGFDGEVVVSCYRAGAVGPGDGCDLVFVCFEEFVDYEFAALAAGLLNLVDGWWGVRVSYLHPRLLLFRCSLDSATWCSVYTFSELFAAVFDGRHVDPLVSQFFVTPQEEQTWLLYHHDAPAYSTMPAPTSFTATSV